MKEERTNIQHLTFSFEEEEEEDENEEVDKEEDEEEEEKEKVEEEEEWSNKCEIFSIGKQTKRFLLSVTLSERILQLNTMIMIDEGENY